MMPMKARKQLMLILFVFVGLLSAAPASAQVQKATVKIDGMI